VGRPQLNQSVCVHLYVCVCMCVPACVYVCAGLCVCVCMRVYMCRVSFYELSVDDGSWQKQKSSGMLICPGTGSTSWHLNINHVSFQQVEDILHAAGETHCVCVSRQDDGRPVVTILESCMVMAMVGIPRLPWNSHGNGHKTCSNTAGWTRYCGVAAKIVQVHAVICQ